MRCKFVMLILVRIVILHSVRGGNVMRQYFENGLTVIVIEEEDIQPRSKVGYAGIQQSKYGNYYVRTSNTYLGVYETLEEAIAVRKESIRQRNAGTIKEWAEELRRKRS